MILGITGGTGCGKTTLLRLIAANGGLVLDCDEIYHEMLQSDEALLGAIRSRFPAAFESGCFDRKKLGSIVFADENALADLNSITHSAIRQEVIRRLSGWEGHAAVDAIALFESGLNELCDVTVTVTAPVEARVARLMERDSISEDYARARINAQHPDSWFQERCDTTLENSAGRIVFVEKCIAFLAKCGIISVAQD